MLKRLHEFIQTKNLIAPKDTILLAVSGGMDSMVMLHMLHNLANAFDMRLTVLHVNHGTRGAESDADEILVRQLCEDWKLPLKTKHLKNLSGSSSEEAMRDARYQAFEQARSKFAQAKVATAHHLDDQFETFLMRLAKGATPRGLTGIPLKRDFYIRPLLIFTRSEIEAYQQKYNVPFRQDSSNKDISKKRNLIRHKLVPVFLEVFDGSFYKGFSKSLTEIKEIVDAFENENAQYFAEIVTTESNECRMSTTEYLALNSVRRRALFQYCVSRLNPLNSLASKNLWESFERFVANATVGSRYQLGLQLFVLKNRNELLFFKELSITAEEMELNPGKSVLWGNYKISMQKLEREEPVFTNDGCTEYFSAKKVTFPLVIRAWKKGDIFYPLGMDGTKKVSDFFTDQKVDRDKKSQIPLVCAGEQILWVAGMRLDSRFKLGPKNEQVYKLTITDEGTV